MAEGEKRQEMMKTIELIKNLGDSGFFDRT
jgi:hypothetical protein